MSLILSGIAHQSMRSLPSSLRITSVVRQQLGSRLLDGPLRRWKVLRFYSTLPTEAELKEKDKSPAATANATARIQSQIINTYEAHVQEQLRTKKPSRLPIWMRMLIARIKIKLKGRDPHMDPELKLLLDKSSAQLYSSCSNHVPYRLLAEAFGLPDSLSSWFKLTNMHIWMVLLRLHTSLEPATYERFCHGNILSLALGLPMYDEAPINYNRIFPAFWADVDKRIEVIKRDYKQTYDKDSAGIAQGAFIQAFFEYDEGFLASDAMLAAAVWRNLYETGEFDIIHVNRVVRYIRATVNFLDKMDADDLLVTGIEVWKPAETIARGEDGLI